MVRLMPKGSSADDLKTDGTTKDRLVLYRGEDVVQRGILAIFLRFGHSVAAK